MSWQSKVACWLLRRQFRPETLRPVIDAARARRLTKLRVRVPRRAPAGKSRRHRSTPTAQPAS